VSDARLIHPVAAAYVLVLMDAATRRRPRARWYALSLEPTLFGGVDLVRR
jgi:hypothetical protein